MLHAAAPVTAADLVFINLDGAGEGLNDPTPASPSGGNPGTTVGERRLLVLEEAGRIWGRFLVSTVPIRVEVEFSSLSSGVLAGAAPIDLEENFANAPVADTWYPVALANSLAGADLQPSRNDITVTVNSNADFYLGFDGDGPGSQSDLLDVMLHEIGHGLGFISYVDEATGGLFAGSIDIFSSFIFDAQVQKPWTAMTSSERAASVDNDPFLVWRGPSATAGFPAILDPASGGSGTDIFIDEGGGNARQVGYLPALFGPDVSAAEGLSVEVIVADDGSTAPGPAEPGVPGTTTDACQPIINAAAMNGKVAMVRRGACNFDDKVWRAQVAGASAVLVANNVDGALVSMSGDGEVDGSTVSITIPAVFISQAEGDAIESAPPGTLVSFSGGANLFAGTNDGFLRIHAPASVQPGSSLSHWTTDASPNLLMEPIINANLDRDLDLTLTQMKDIGWEVVDIPFPHLTYDLWRDCEFPAGAVLTGRHEDADRDGVTNFEEYVFASDPLEAGDGNLPVIVLDEGVKSVSFTRTTLSTDLAFAFEKSGDLLSFVPAVEGVDFTTPSIVPAGPGAERVTFEILTPGTRQFFRVRVTTP
ncbi:MAG: hypothetical protein HKN82_10900 [Akkermansiaceae bacterium]|nr:hypothetical protein [Akkermansiaceae bacterium]